MPDHGAWLGTWKNYVGRAPDPHTSLVDLERLLREGFYGCQRVWVHPKKPWISRVIDHAPPDPVKLIAHSEERQSLDC